MQHIVVGVDASPRATLVLDEASELARRLGGKLIVVRVVPLPTELPLEAFVVPQASLTDMLLRESRKGLEELLRRVPLDLVESVRVEPGVPWHVLCEIATEARASLLVIGSHGYGVIDRILGTTAARVVNHADCSVLVVRPVTTPQAQP